MAGHRKVERTRRLALPFQAVLALAIVALGVSVAFIASGGVGRLATSLGTTFAGLVQDLTATPVPTASPIVVSDAPLLQEPLEPYTNQAAIDLVGSVPTELVGDPDHRIRIYLAIGEQAAAPITEIAIGRTQRFLVPGVALTEGTNAFTATITGPAGESEPSPVVTYVLDKTIPPMALVSPGNGSTVNAAEVTLVGTTQPRSQVRIRNATTSAIVSGTADENGSYTLVLPIVAGTNDIEITAIDPAGNDNHLIITIRRGSGKLTATISADDYTIAVGSLPTRVELAVLVNDPDGQPLVGAGVTFSIAIPSVQVLSSRELLTGGDGYVRWGVTIPEGATAGQASATAIIRTEAYGDLTARTVVNLVR